MRRQPRAPVTAQALPRDDQGGGRALWDPAPQRRGERLVRGTHGAPVRLSFMVSKATRFDGPPESVPEVRFGARGRQEPHPSSTPAYQGATVRYYHRIAITDTGDDGLN
jgi:hypothetical protein